MRRRPEVFDVEKIKFKRTLAFILASVMAFGSPVSALADTAEEAKTKDKSGQLPTDYTDADIEDVDYYLKTGILRLFPTSWTKY